MKKAVSNVLLLRLLHDEFLHCGDEDDTAAQLNESFCLHIVERTRDFQSAVVEFFCQSCHLDFQSLGAGGAQAMGFHKRDDSLLQTACSRMPQSPLVFLALGGKDVQQVQAENVDVGQLVHFVFAQRQKAAWRSGTEAAGVALSQPEEAFWLQDVGCFHLFDELVAMVIGHSRHFEFSFEQEKQMVASITFSDNLDTGVIFVKSKRSLPDSCCQVSHAHTLEKRQFEQPFVNIGIIVHV